MKQFFSFLVLSLVISLPLTAQISTEALLQDLHWRNIGPANQGGRIVDIEALDNDFTNVWLATGSGGVWHSNNAGNSWTPIFEQYETASIGDIAVDQRNPQTIWVGTGEANNRNSVSWGNGVYKSTNGGEDFQLMGLENTHQIARVLIHPKSSDDVCVCAIGHLWGYKGERGLFRTTDGGKTFQKLTNGLPDDGKTGCNDLVRDPSNPNILYASFYHRLRRPWTFTSGGEQGGIYKSTNGGKSWRKLTRGLPTPTGRIGLAIYKDNPKILMALVEAEASDTTAVLGSGVYRSENGGETWTYVNTYNNRPFYYSQIRINPSDDQRVYLLTTRFMVSEDGGQTFHNGSQDQEVHGDFHAMWLDPNDKDRYYLGADKGPSLTQDHGEHFVLYDNIAIGQFYRIGLDMRDPYYVYGGLQDNGMYGVASFSRDARGILNDSNWKLHWGDGEHVFVDPTNWRNVFTSSENGSLNRYDPVTHRIISITPNHLNTSNYDLLKTALKEDNDALRFNWTSPFIPSPQDPNTLYMAGNHVFKSVDQGRSWTIISPDLSTNDPEKRKLGESGGITPDNTGAETHCAASTLAASPIHPDLIWVGTDDGNVQLTQDGGQTWTNVRANVPDVPAGIWVSRIEASHFAAGTAYLSFDGHRSDNNQPWLFRTTDYGKNWQRITNGLGEQEVIRVVREDLRNPRLLFIGTETGIWFSLNSGQSWDRLHPNLPTVSIYDLRIHPRDNDLVAGTHGRSMWIMDDISPLQQMTPAIQQAKAHLFEQGRATLWENISRGGQRGHFLFMGENPRTVKNTSSKPRARTRNLAAISYMLGEGVGSAQLEISDQAGLHQRVIDLPTEVGLHRYYWDLAFDSAPLTSAERQQVEDQFQQQMEFDHSRRLQRRYNAWKEAETVEEERGIASSFPELGPGFQIPIAGPGSYLLKLTVDGVLMTTTLEVRADPLVTQH